MRIIYSLILASTFLYTLFSCRNELSEQNNSEIKYGKNSLAIKYLGNNQFRIYLAPSLKIENALVEFGHYDKISHTIVPDDSSDIAVKKLDNYFEILNHNIKTNVGYIKIPRDDKQHFDYYVFEMRKE